MKAIGYRKPLPIESPESLIDLDLPTPTAAGHDLLVAVKAVSVNPVDTKVRASASPANEEYKVLGWDAAGTVLATGPEVTRFKPGDEVFYAGSLLRPGTNQEFHLVDERLVGAKPKTLGFSEAAAMPLTGLTAWELLFERLGVEPGKASKGKTLLIIGGAGGVGSIMIQLARQLTELTVVATASRPESQQWCRELGAHHVLDHSRSLAEQMKAIQIPEAELVVSLTATGAHYPALLDVLAPQGKFGLIDDPPSLDATELKRKSASLHWEFMFTRAVFNTADMDTQNKILNQLSTLVDQGTIRTTLAQTFGTINAANLKRAHALIESGRSRGKIVLEGWS